MGKFRHLLAVGLAVLAMSVCSVGVMAANQGTNGSNLTPKAIPNDIQRGGFRLWKSDTDRVNTLKDHLGYVEPGKDLDDVYENMDPNAGYSQLQPGYTGPDYSQYSWAGMAQGDASLSGAVFEVKNVSGQPVVIEGHTYQDGDVIGSVTTDADGYAYWGELKYDLEGNIISNTCNLPFGDYELREVRAPGGRDVDTAWRGLAQIRNDREIVDVNNWNNNQVKDTIWRGGFKMQKMDERLGYANEGIPSGDAILEAEFEVYNQSIDAVYVNGQWFEPGEVCWTFKTDKKGYYESPNNLLPYGSYYVKEKTPGEGYLLNKDWMASFKIREKGHIEDLTLTQCIETPKAGDVMIEKYDRDTQTSNAIGGNGHAVTSSGATLSGVVFEITNESKSKIKYTDPETGKEKYVEPGQVVTRITTHWNEDEKKYTAETKDKALSYGTYKIREIGYRDAYGTLVASNGTYVIIDEGERTFQIRNDGEVVKADKDGQPLHWFNKIVRGDVGFNKVAKDTNAGMDTVWVVTNITTGERHVIRTDRNGRFDSCRKYEGIDHEQLTNVNDGLLERIDNNEKILLNVDEPEAIETGIWFSQDEVGNLVNPNTLEGAFPYGVYEFQEVRSDTNEGFGLARFYVNVYYNNHFHERGTVSDTPITMSTVAIDAATGIHTGFTSREAVILDEVKYGGLDAGKSYTLETSLVDSATGTVIAAKDATTGELVEIKSTTGFTAENTEGTVKTELKYNAEEFAAGKTVTVIQKLFDSDGNFIYGHTDPLDESEQVSYPSIGTRAYNEQTMGHDSPASGQVTIVDMVRYDNLVPGYSYTITGTAVDAASGTILQDITGSETFTPKLSSGEIPVKFTFDASSLAGKKIVFYERLMYEGKTIATHEDITDEEQAIYFPEIGTKASYDNTDSQVAPAGENVIIKDAVSYTGLVVGNTYTLKGVLMDKETGKPLLVDGKEITAETQFTADKTEGVVYMDFVFNATGLTGKKVVVFETLYKDGKEITSHTDIEDEGQTITFVKLWSNATFTENGLREGVAVENTRITETLYYENLEPGKEYEIVAYPMVYASHGHVQAIVTGDGASGTAPVEKRVLYIPESANGSVDIEFVFDARNYVGHKLVMFDEVYLGGKLVAEHKDWEDAEQTLRFPSIGTTLTNSNTGDHLGQTVEELKVVDTVAYRNLIPGEKYTMKGHLVDGNTSERISDETEVTFVPETEDGTIDMEFTIDARKLGGHSIVAFEYLYRNEVEIARHEDITDEGQTLRFPTISTLLHSRDDDTLKEIQVSDAAMLTDTITYTGLVPNYTYKLKGQLVERSSGEVIKDEHGDYVEREITFTPTEPNGTQRMDFAFSSIGMEGQYVVAYEELFVVKVDENGKFTEVSLNVEKDINNAQQTIHFIDRPYQTPDITPTPTIPVPDRTPNPDRTPTPDETPRPSETPDGPWIRTRALDKNTQTHLSEYNKESVIVDTVTYGNLTPGKTYVMTGTLMNKDTGKPVTDAQGNPLTSSTTFTPEKSEGTVEMEFKIDSTTFPGAHLVVFEKLFDTKATDETPAPGETPKPGTPDKEITKHEDLNDEDQSIYVVEIGTKATVNGEKATKPSETTAVVDEIGFKNLIPGVKYTMVGMLVDKTTQKPITLKDGGTQVEMQFTPETSSGSVNMTFVFDSTGMQNATLVACEYLYDSNNYLLAYHADLDDEAQTVFVNEEGKAPVNPDTGVDNSTLWLLGAVAVLMSAAAGIVALMIYKKRRQDELF